MNRPVPEACSNPRARNKLLEIPSVEGRRAAVVRLFRATMMVAGANSYVIVASFARGVLLARLLGPDEYGLAVILITIAASLDLLTDGGVDQYLVRSRFGARPDVVAVAQAYRVGAACLGAILLIVGARPLASALGAPQLSLAIALLAAPMTARSFSNIGIKLQQRQRRYEQETKVDVLRASAELVALTIAVFFMRSYWAVLIGLSVNAAVQLVASAAICGEPPRISYRPRPARLVARFSSPVIVNSLILFAATQGDRLVIANAFDPARVALYAAACAIGQAGATLLSRVILRVLLPLFGAASVGRPEKRRQADLLTFAVIAASLAIAVGLSLIVPGLVPLIYGPAFSDVRDIVIASAALQMLQIEQAWLTTLMTGAGATAKFPLITGVRALALPLVLPLLWKTANILLAPFALTIGALASLMLSYRALLALNVLSLQPALLSLIRGALTILWLYAFLL